jgi:thiamine transport system ATP-binding protein
LGGFISVARGHIRCAGAEITHAAPGARPIAMLFQDNNLFPHLTIGQNVALGLRGTLRLNADDAARVKGAIDRVGLSGMEARKPSALSGGQQSRAALARVLVQGKPLLLLDEPFAALGPALRHEMLDLVRDLVSETVATLLMVTHAPDDVARLADDVIYVDAGRARSPQPAAEMMANPPPAMKAYLG